MRVLLTGGCGFIGSHMAKEFVDRGWEVVIIDGLTYAGDVQRVVELDLDMRAVSIYWHDLRAPIPPSLDKRIGAIDAVVNAASSTHVDRSITDARDFYINNVMLGITMLEWARSRELSHFIQISTDEVYGPAPAGFFHKEWDPVIPSNPYSASKAAQEAASISYWRTFNIPVVITNTMNNIGPRQDPEKFVPLVIRRLMRGESVPVHAKPSPEGWVASSRVWLDASSHADAAAFLLERAVSRYPEVDRPDRWHVIGDSEIDCGEIVRIIAGVLGVEPAIEWVDYHSQRPGHDHRYALDGSKLADAGWTPPISTEEALVKTVNWYLEHEDWLGL